MSWMNELRESIVKVREERVKSGIATKKIEFRGLAQES